MMTADGQRQDARACRGCPACRRRARKQQQPKAKKKNAPGRVRQPGQAQRHAASAAGRRRSGGRVRRPQNMDPAALQKAHGRLRAARRTCATGSASSPASDPESATCGPAAAPARRGAARRGAPGPLGRRRGDPAPSRYATPRRLVRRAGSCPDWSTPTATSVWRPTGAVPDDAGRAACAGRPGRRRAAAARRRQPGRHPLDRRPRRPAADHPRRTPHRPPEALPAQLRRRGRARRAGRRGRAPGGAAATAGSSWSGTGSTGTSATSPRCGRSTRRRAAIARAHELGVRVTAHVFGEQAAAELVAAGIDGIEHGTGHRRRRDRADGRASGRPGADHAAAGQLRALRRGRVRRGSRPTLRHMRALYARRLDTFGGRARRRRADLRRHRRRRLSAARTGRRRRSRRWAPSCRPRTRLGRRVVGGPRPGSAVPTTLVDGAPADLSCSTPTRAPTWRCCGRRG